MSPSLNQARQICVTVVLTLLLPMLLAGCSDDDPVLVASTPVARLTGYEGCVRFDLDANPAGCLQVRYEKDILHIRHVNAGFNCCPGEITANITVAQGEIVIDEKESESACRCLCLYTVDYEIENLTPGEYVIRVNELYLSAGDEPLVCTVDITAGSVEECCVDRPDYPWSL